MKKTVIPQNYENTVKWVFGAYEDANVSLEDGVQKDIIQNAVGAREDDSWDGWRCEISCLENEYNKFLIIEDFGTTGLIGKNMTAEQINKMMEEGKTFSPKEKLSRFTSLFNSGGNITGAGLYGVGKTIYSAISSCCRYIFDSLDKNGRYVANENDHGRVYDKSFEGKEAKDFIKRTTGLDPKTTHGTRIIIVSPVNELVNSIQNGTIIPFIQESWWKSIEEMPSDSGIYINGKKIGVPKNLFKNATHSFKIKKPENFKIKDPENGKYYKVKNFYFGIYDNADNVWNGISYIRKGMKIEDIDLKDIPENLKDKYWGYIEVDDEWEEELSKIEDNIHFGISRNKKSAKQYVLLRTYCNEKMNKCLTDWGYFSGDKAEDKKFSQMIDDIRNEVFNKFNRLGFNDLNIGPRKACLSTSFKNIVFPTYGSEKVTSGDKITFDVKFDSTYSKKKTISYKIYVQDMQTKNIVSTIVSSGKVNIESGKSVTRHFKHTVSIENSSQYSENKIILETRANGNKAWKKKDFSFFYDIDKPVPLLSPISLNLNSCIFPTKGSRRVDFGESLLDISYTIGNKRNRNLNYKLKVSVYNVSGQKHEKIRDIKTFSGTVLPLEECAGLKIDKILFDKESYSPYIEHGEHGVLEIRAELTAGKDDEDYESGDLIASSAFKLYLNMEENRAKGESFEIRLVDEPNDFRRAWSVAGNNRTVYINAAHREYLTYKDYDNLQKGYMTRRVMEQMLLMYLEEGNYKIFSKDEAGFLNLGQQEMIESFISKRDNILFGDLK